MRKYLIMLLITSIFLVASAYGGDLFVNRSGSIPMQPYTSEELGIRGVRPFYCSPLTPGTFDCSALNSNSSLVIMNQIAFPGTRQDFVALLSEQTGINDLPGQVGTYRGKNLVWKLYEFDMVNETLGPTVFHAHIALAEDQTHVYLIALAALPSDYQANHALYQTVIDHSLYAFEPLERNQE